MVRVTPETHARLQSLALRSGLEMTVILELLVQAIYADPTFLQKKR